MIKHIVMWRLAREPGDIYPEKQAHEMQTRLTALQGKIPEIQNFEVGLDINRSDRAFDVVLVSSFASRDDLAAYSRHPLHQELVEFFRAITSEVRVVDYEV